LTGIYSYGKNNIALANILKAQDKKKSWANNTYNASLLRGRKTE
jgi:hypothetical protein